MRAIVVRTFGGPEVLCFEDVPPLTPSPAQVLVRTRAIGVNPVDTYIRTGAHAIKPALPYTPGVDAAGVVEAIGAEATGASVGDRVYIANDNTILPRTGTYAEHVLCQPTQLHSLPTHVSFEQGAAVGVPYVTAYCALFQRAQARAGETVLVHGASGGVGLAAVQLARAQGLRVLGTAGTEHGLRTVREQGAAAVFNHHDPNHADAIVRATGGSGPDVILEMAAHVNLDRDLSMIARFGRIIVIGNRGRIEIDPRQIMTRQASVLGLTLFAIRAEDLASAHAAIGAGLANGTLTPIVGRQLPLAEAAAAHVAVLEPGALGKIILTP